MGSVRTTIWILFSIALVTVLVAFFALRGGIGPRSAATKDGPGEEPQPAVEAPRFDGSWPMFHGGQGLLGRAQGTLADSLTLLWRFKTEAEVKSSPAIEGGAGLRRLLGWSTLRS